jgi:hypothetical protein
MILLEAKVTNSPVEVVGVEIINNLIETALDNAPDPGNITADDEASRLNYRDICVGDHVACKEAWEGRHTGNVLIGCVRLKHDGCIIVYNDVHNIYRAFNPERHIVMASDDFV